MKVTADKITRQYIRQSKNVSSNIMNALKETSLSLEPGKIVEIVGRSGSGKSTLLNVLAGLLSPTQGKLFYDETDIYALSDEERSLFRNQHIGVIPQVQTGLQSLTVKENILLPCRMYDGAADHEEKAKTLMQTLDILSLEEAYPNELSGGEMRRLAIARALIRTPEVILADEPTGDLDDENTRVVFHLLRKAADKGAAVLIVTHEKEGAEYADQLLRMSDGVLTVSE